MSTIGDPRFRVFLVYFDGPDELLASAEHDTPTVPLRHPEMMVCHHWEDAHSILTQNRAAGRVAGGRVIMGDTIDDAWARRNEVPF